MGSEVQVLPGPPLNRKCCNAGGIAQLVERVLCKHEVIGSIPFTSTIKVASVVMVKSEKFKRIDLKTFLVFLNQLFVRSS